MCNECHSYPHRPGCPNEPEPPIVYYCSECKEPIYDGAEYYHVGEERYCIDCMRNFMSVAELEVDYVWDED